MTTLSVRCLSNGPLDRLEAILSLYRPFADEIVAFVNSRFLPSELDGINRVADRVIPCEMGSDFIIEQYRAWQYQIENTCDWVFVTDHDEVPSTALLNNLRSLIEAPDIVSYSITRRWVYPDSDHWIDQYPWHPDWQINLLRNDPATLHFGGRAHQAALLVEPYRFVDLPMYHLDCLINSLEARRKKVAYYDSYGSSQLADGRSINAVYYLPELQETGTPVEIPKEDREMIESVLDADTTNGRIIGSSDPFEPGERHLAGTVTSKEIVRFWPGRILPSSAYSASVTLLHWALGPRREIGVFRAGEQRALTTLIRNSGTEVWPRALREPKIALGSRWFQADANNQDLVLRAEGNWASFASDLKPGDELIQPIVIQAPLEPGAYVLVIDCVHDGVRWFDAGPRLAVQVLSGEAET
jgi:hypothetical protein